MTNQRHLKEAFGFAASDHFEWQTTCPVVSVKERELVSAAFGPLGARVLDLGCAEGETLKHLGEPAHAVGVDIFWEKLSFARDHVRHGLYVVASGGELPFASGSFDHILVRDVIHHVPEPSVLIEECRRVLVPGGRIDVLEPCRYNPLIFLHAVTHRAERWELRSTQRYLRGLLSRRFALTKIEHYQPFPLHRLVYHPEIGNPRWASAAWIRGMVEGIEKSARLLMPKVTWAYLHLRAEMR